MPVWDRWSKRLFFFTSYFGKPRWDTGISPPELLDFLQTHPPGRALDLGCGTGTNVITLASRGWEVTGVDFIPAAVDAARKKIRESKVQARILHGDVTRLGNLTGLYDLALDIGCYHNLSDQGKIDYQINLIRLLTSGGTLLLYGFLSTPNRKSGISSLDIERLSSGFDLQQRKDGLDREKPSTWLEYQKPVPK